MSAATLPRTNFRIVAAVIAFAAVAGALAWSWKHTELAEWVSLEATVDWIRTFQGHWWAPVVVVLAYIAAMLTLFPRPLLTVAAVVVFGAWLGFTYAMVGVLVSGQLAYYAGRLVDESRLERMGGRKYAQMKRILQRKGLMAVTAMRILPGPPFFVESMAAGVLRVKAWHHLAGTFLGMAPGMFLTTVMGHQVSALLSDAREVNRGVIAAVVVAFVAMTWATHRWYKRNLANSGV